MGDGASTGTDGSGAAVEPVANPRHLTRRLAELGKAQQALAACRKTGRRDGGRRMKAKARVTGLHRQVANARKDHNHQLSRRLVDSFDEIVFEQLTIANMTRSAAGTLESPGLELAAKSGLNRSILDAGWGQLVSFTTYCPNLPAAAGRTRLLQAPVVGGQGGGRPHLADLCPVRAHGCSQPRHLGPLLLHVVRPCRPRHANAAKVVLAVGEGRLEIKSPRKRRQKNPRPGSGHPPVTAGRDAAWPRIVK